jgi:hypothetical protein
MDNSTLTKLALIFQRAGDEQLVKANTELQESKGMVADSSG